MCNATVSSTGVNSTAVTAHVHWQTVLMTTCSIDARYVAVRRQFPDSALGGTLPHIATQIRLHIVMGLTAAGVGNRYNVIMIATGLCGV